MDRALASWQVGGAAQGRLPALLEELAAALTGAGPALAPTGRPAPGLPATLPPAAAEDTALAVATSGSSGAARRVLLGGAALRASAERTHARLGGPGRWLLALPLEHVAGLQVLVRSVVAGTVPVVAGPSPEAMAATVRAAVAEGSPAMRLYTAIVPTQLHRIVAAARGGGLPRDLAPLRELDAILVGGAGAADGLLAAGRHLGLHLVTTYGMTETCGGCVYDGVPLEDVRLGLQDGVLRVAGPVLAGGYLLDGEVLDDGFETDPDGDRWFRTADLGRLDDGRLIVLGRRDDVIVTGGVNVNPTDVEAVLVALDEVGEVCVVGVPDEEWGHRVTAVVVQATGAAPVLARLRDAVTRSLGSASAPRAVVLVDSLPLRGPGKVDRAAAGRLALMTPATTGTERARQD